MVLAFAVISPNSNCPKLDRKMAAERNPSLTKNLVDLTCTSFDSAWSSDSHTGSACILDRSNCFEELHREIHEQRVQASLGD